MSQFPGQPPPPGPAPWQPAPPPGPPPPPPRARRRGLVVALVVAAALVAGLVSAGVVLIVNRAGSPAPRAVAVTPRPTPRSSPSETPAPTESGALQPVQFSDPDGHFSALYAQAPVRDDQSETVRGVKLTITQWAAIVTVNDAEIIGYTTYPVSAIANPNAVLEGSVAGEASSTSATVLSKQLGHTQGFPSIDAVLQVQGGYVESRTILAGRTLFFIVATGLDNPPLNFALFAPTMQILSHS